MTQDEKLDTINAMVLYGGSFVRALSQAWLRADARNAAKIEMAFPEYIKEYQEIAKQTAASR